MSNVKITELPLLTSVDVCNSLIPIEQCGVTYSTYACNVGGGGGGGFTTANPFYGCCNHINASACSSSVSGLGSVVASENSSILSGAFNVIACDALPNSQSGGYFNGFVSGATTLAACFGDLTAYYSVGSTVSSQDLYGDPQINYFDMVVCGSSFDGTATTICVDPTINTCSGYLIKSGTFSTYSGYHANTISGGSFNTINGYTSNSTISGGYHNTISGGYGTISGGYCNTTCSGGGFIGGGRNNIANGGLIVGGRNNIANGGLIGGGQNNIICSGAHFSAIVSGSYNTISTYSSFIGSGAYNSINIGQNAFIGNGAHNTACGTNSSVLNGCCNNALADCSFILGGKTNTTSGAYSIVLGGQQNIACGGQSIIIQGGSNSISASYGDNGVIINGGNSQIQRGYFSFIGNGNTNIINAASNNAILNGNFNTISGNYNETSFIMGSCNVIDASQGVIFGNNNCTCGFTQATIIGNGICAVASNTLHISGLWSCGLPTSAAGLPTGTIWNNSGVLNIA